MIDAPASEHTDSEDLSADYPYEWDAVADQAFGELGLVTSPPGRALDFDLGDVEVEPWSPPAPSFELSFEQLIGGGPCDDILPRTTIDNDGFDRLIYRQQVRTLPSKLRHQLQQFELQFLGSEVLAWLESEVMTVARKRNLFVEARGPGMDRSVWYLPAIDRRRILQELVRQAHFCGHLGRIIRDCKLRAHKVAMFGDWPRALPTQLPICTPPSSGCWSVESWLGVTQRAMPEDLPEGAHVGIAQLIWSNLSGRRGIRRDVRQELLSKATGRPAKRQPGAVRAVGRVLNWGALASTLTLALKATAPASIKGSEPSVIDVDEVETLGQPKSLPWVQYRGADMRERGYDTVVAHLPPPGVGGNQLRNRYKDLGGTSIQSQRELPDMGRYGPKRWLKHRRQLLPELVRRTRQEGLLVVCHPLGARQARKEPGHRMPVWSYLPQPGLTHGLTAHLQRLGMRIIADVVIEEKRPIRQAVFGTQRCSWRCVVSRHLTDDSDNCVGLEDEDIDRA